MLWLALVFPKLPLEAQSDRAAAGQTSCGAIVVECGHVCVTDALAEAAGVMPGMRLSTARAMLPDARLVERDAAALQREQQALDALACFCGNFTSTVCLAPPATLLLDIAGSQRLFGGLAPIAAGLREGCRERGMTVQIGLAPTPRGASWLARRDPPDQSRIANAPALDPACCCLTREALPDMLARLPLGVLDASADVMTRLQGFGARRIGDLLAMPRAGLARRISSEPVEHLLQAIGELPDLRTPETFAETFRHAVELPAPASDAAMLAFPARRLLLDLCGWLAVRQSGTAACQLVLQPERRGLPAQTVDLRLSVPSRDPDRFLRLLRDRLERTRLSAPVGDIVLVADDIVLLPGVNRSLLDLRVPAAPLDVLLERLRARLGEDAVHGLRVHPDHRPECATRSAAVGFADQATSTSTPAWPAGLRPLSLLETPEALSEIAGGPARHGEALELLSGPERIESGWWDEGETAGPVCNDPDRAPESAQDRATVKAPGDVRRDYFLARSRQGEVWWIFRDALGWWAQGLGLAPQR